MIDIRADLGVVVVKMCAFAGCDFTIFIIYPDISSVRDFKQFFVIAVDEPDFFNISLFLFFAS
jgi:hypothetical protein